MVGGYKKNEEVTIQEDLEISHKISSFQTECLPLLVLPLSSLHRASAGMGEAFPRRLNLWSFILVRSLMLI